MFIHIEIIINSWVPDFQGPYELEGETDWTEEEPESNILERYTHIRIQRPQISKTCISR